jgi:hypothetical protein
MRHNRGTILHYDGTGWSAMNSGTGNRLSGVWCGGWMDVFAVGSYGTILHYGIEPHKIYLPLALKNAS